MILGVPPMMMGRRKGVVAYRYFRLNILNSFSGDGNGGIGEIELRAEVGGSDLTVPGGTITASDEAPFGPAVNAFGDNGGTLKWYTDNGAGFPQWIQYDFGAGNEKTVAEVMLQAANTTSTRAFSPESFEILASNDASIWDVVLSVSGESAWASNEIRVYSL